MLLMTINEAFSCGIQNDSAFMNYDENAVGIAWAKGEAGGRLRTLSWPHQV